MTTKAHALPGHSLGGRASRIIDRIGPAWCLVILYALFVLVQTLVNGYCKHIETYMDEWIYYGFAESLAKGMGFPTIYGEAYPQSTRYLYSLLIIPGLLVSNRILQFRLIAMLNALMIGGGVFPVYLLAKRVLKENKFAVLAGAVYLLLPDMEFTATFMTENLWLPIALWVIWFFFRLVSEEDSSVKTRLINIALLILSSIVLVNVKGSGVSIVVALVLYYVAFRAYQFVTGRDWENKTTGLLIGILLLVAGFVVLFILLGSSPGIVKQILVAGTGVSTHITTDPAKYAWGYAYTWATDILAMGIFPFALPLLSFRKLSPLARRLFLLAVLLTFVVNLGITTTSLNIAEEFEFTGLPLYHRYKMYLWVLYLIPFMYVLMHEPRIPIVAAGLLVIATLAFCLAFKGLDFTSAVDMTMLHWAADWLNHWKLWVVVVVSFVCAGLLLLRLGHKRLFGSLFLCVMLVVTAYNHYAMHQMIEIAYGFDYSEIESVEQFIKDNPDDTFLVVTLPINLKTDDVHYNAKVADTFLPYPNTIFASGKKVMGIQTDQGIDLAEVGMDDTGISIVGPRDIESVDYVVLTNEMSIDESMCEKVAEDGYFSIYRLDDETKIPYMQNFNNWCLPGKTTLLPEAGFASNYFEGDNMVFVSGEKPDYVLSGPGVSLKPGRYTVTVHYAYEGDAEGKIGTMSLNGSVLDSSKLCQDVYAGQAAATITFDIAEQCDAFEVRLLADVPEIRIDSISVEMLALVCVNEEGDVLRQYVNSGNLIVREEKYSSTGGKDEGPEGYFAVEYSYLYGNKVGDAYFDASGQHVMIADGYAMVRREYNAARQVTRQEYFDATGNPVEMPEGYYVLEYAYDGKGRVSRMECFGASGEPVIRSEGYHAVECSYDEEDRYSRLDYYGTNGEPMERPEGYQAVECSYNEENRYSRLDYYNKDGGPANLGGYSSVEYDYDAYGNPTETRYYAASGALTTLPMGYAMVRAVYDEDGRVTREEYFGTSGEPVERSEGYHAVEYSYDGEGTLVHTTYFNTKNESVNID